MSPIWATDLLSNEALRLPLSMIVAGCLLAMLMNRPKRAPGVRTPGRRRRWRWPFQSRRIPWKLGKVTVDLRGGSQTIHAVVAGMTGSGKSTAVVPLLEQSGPALVVAFDNSRPIRELFEAKGWTIWTPGGALGWNILKGSAQVVSEALTAGFARTSQDTGFYRGMAQERLWEALDTLDDAGDQRTMQALIDGLRVRTGNATQDKACLDWSVRFGRIARSLGRSLGTDLDLAEAMRAGDKVLILPNRFLSPEDAPLVGAIALVQARRVAQEVGNFLLVVEEAGQAGARQVELNALAQAGRDRGCPLVVLTQNMAKLPEEVINNVKVWISFAQESSRETAFAAERLRIDADELDPDAMPTGYAWVRSPDVGPTRVHLKLPRHKVSYSPGPTEINEERPTRRRTVIYELPRYEDLDLPALPPPSALDAEIEARIDRSGHCHLWTGGLDKDGYGIFRIGPKQYRAHRYVWERANGPIGPLEIDHQCRTRNCVKLDHLEPVTKSENVRRRWRVRGVSAS